jgi:aspartate/methionine/tyrosine aminotransferase
MTDSDMFMVRHHTDGHNLSVGEPAFLQHTLDFLTILEPVENLYYPLVGGEKELLEELHRLHPKYKYIVVANGAKQALLASIYALKEQHPVSSEYVEHSAPYWPSFPTLAKLSGLKFSVKTVDGIRIVTSPNNPDGMESITDPPDIWDAAYYNPFYPVYGHTKELAAKITIFSGSKMFGVSSFRIGWLCTDNEYLAKLAAEYVEKSTTGVSGLSQTQMAGILRHVRRYKDAVPEFMKARKLLELNANSFHRALDSHIDIYKGAPQGMFAFIKVKDEQKFTGALKTAKIQVVPGHACGMTESGWFRFSIGWQSEYLDAALIDLGKALNNG